MDKMTIGKVAKFAQVNVETIRYYQRINLLSTPEKTNGKTRYYTDEFLHRLQFIKRAQNLSFTLKEIKELLLFKDSDELSPSEMKRKAGQKVLEIDHKIKDFQKLKDYLIDLVDSCSGDGNLDNCPIYKVIQ